MECDQNPLEARQTLEALLGPGTSVVESGGEWSSTATGEIEPKVHLHWRLKKPASTKAEHELLYEARALATKLVGGDDTNKSIVHPIRWPGSWHRKKTPRLAKIVASSDDNEIDLAEAVELLRDKVGQLDFGKAGVKANGELEAADHAAVPAALAVIPNDSDLKDHDWNWWNEIGMKTWAATGGTEDGAKAFHEWSAKAGKYNREETDKRWDHYSKHPPTKAGFGSLVYLARKYSPGWTYGSANASAIDPDVARMNEKYALVIVGDKTAVLKLKGKEISFLSVEAFGQWHANQLVYRNDKWIPLAKYWMGHRQRRQFEGIVFDPSRHEVPGYFNLWRGFSVEPRPGDCFKFLAHLRDNVCRGDEALYNWVVGWFAQMVQRPAKKVGTSLVLRGPQGVGKTKVGEVFGSLFNAHYALVSDPRYITGRFNAHLKSCLLLHCDEAFWAGDHAAEGKLKDLVTGDHHFVEFKGKEVIRIQNYVRLLVCGNPNWLVPAGFGERRFAVLDVGENHKEDHAYFAAIDAEMDNGGREALLHHLLNFDLTTVNLRTIPKTTALLDQQLASLDAEQGWWLDVLSRGLLPWGCDGNSNCCPSDRLFDRYVKHAGRTGVRRKSIQTKLGMFLNKHVPGLRRLTHVPYAIWTKTKGLQEANGTIYEFPALEKCRQAFAAAMQQAFPWDDTEDWTLEPPPDGERNDDDDGPI